VKEFGMLVVLGKAHSEGEVAAIRTGALIEAIQSTVAAV